MNEGVVAPELVWCRYLDIVCAFIWQVVFEHQPVRNWSIVGAVLVTSCALANPLKMWRASVLRARAARAVPDPCSTEGVLGLGKGDASVASKSSSPTSASSSPLAPTTPSPSPSLSPVTTLASAVPHAR
jgi:hypothetical protein